MKRNAICSKVIWLIAILLTASLLLGACEDRRSYKSDDSSSSENGERPPKLVVTPDGVKVVDSDDTPPPASPTTAPEKETTAPVRETTAPVQQDAGASDKGISYSALSNEKQKQLYEGLVKIAQKVTDKKNDDLYETEKLKLSYAFDDNHTVDMDTAFAAVIADYPQFFWLARSWSYQTITSSSGGSTDVTLYSHYSPSQITQMRSQIDAEVQKFRRSVPKDLSSYELEKYIHDYVCDACSYNKAVGDAKSEGERDKLIEKSPNLSNVYGVFIDGDAVCAGYAHAFKLLCDASGLESAHITGLGDGGKHAWNAVKLDGDWYMLDVTWDDKDDPLLRYQYLNMTSKQMFKDHEATTYSKHPDSSDITPNAFLPDCKGSRYDYYAYDKDCYQIDKLDSDQFGKAFAAAYQAGSTDVILHFNGIKYSDVMAKVESSDGYMTEFMADAMEYLNKHTDADLESFSYYSLESRNALAFRLVGKVGDGKSRQLTEEKNYTM